MRGVRGNLGGNNFRVVICGDSSHVVVNCGQDRDGLLGDINTFQIPKCKTKNVVYHVYNVIIFSERVFTSKDGGSLRDTREALLQGF
jgi:hypothetical protein